MKNYDDIVPPQAKKAEIFTLNTKDVHMEESATTRPHDSMQNRFQISVYSSYSK